MIRAVILMVVLAFPAWAMDPSEMLSDPALEERARALDHALRCVVCQSESVASSNANWAEDARRTVRELISDGSTDEEVFDFFVARYGEFVLMSPRPSGSNWLLWAIWFAARMQGIALVPEPLWWLLGVIVSFYFGARHQIKNQHFQRSIAQAVALAPKAAQNI